MGEVGRDHSVSSGPPLPAASSQSTWHKIVSRWFLSISSEGETPQPLWAKITNVPETWAKEVSLPEYDYITVWKSEIGNLKLFAEVSEPLVQHVAYVFKVSKWEDQKWKIFSGMW